MTTAPSALSAGNTSSNFNFADHKLVLNDTNKNVSYSASTQFPSDPVEYFHRVAAARELVRTGNCADAVSQLEKLVEQYPDQGNMWGLLGKCYGRLKKFDAGAGAYQQALMLGVEPWDQDLGLNPNDIMIEIAGFYAQLDDVENARHWLKRGIEARFDERPGIFSNPKFANLQQDEEFAAITGQPPPGVFSGDELNRDELNRDEKWRYDIAFLRDQVALLHSDPDHHTPAVKLEQMLVDLSAAVPELSDEQITARIDLFIGALGAGHDLFWPVNAQRGALIPFALKLYWFTDGLYIIDAYDPELIGSRIHAFGKTPASEAYDKVMQAFPGDNDMQAKWMSVRHLSQPYTLEALGIIRDATVASLTVTTAAGDQFTFTPEKRPFTPMTPALAAPPSIDPPLFLKHLDKVFWTQSIESMASLYVQVNAVGDTETESFAQFAERVMLEAAQPGIKNMVLDLRHSPGGNGYLSAPLLRTLIHFSASPDKGDLYVIIGRNTFSASHNLITDLDRIAQPIFVGEPSGSRPNALSESGRFRLPFSGLEGMLSSQLHQHSWPEDHRLWIAPDVPVGLSAEDYFAGKDPALTAIATLIEQRKNQLNSQRKNKPVGAK